jgi:hypothetical protein
METRNIYYTPDRDWVFDKGLHLEKFCPDIRWSHDRLFSFTENTFH